MNKVYLFLLALSLVFTSSCEKTELQEDFQTDVELKSAHMKMTRNFRAHLSSDQEVPPVESLATGQATFQLSKDGETLSYKLIVANIEDVRMAHIHLIPSGGVVAWLYPAGPPPQLIPGTTNGILAEGEITADDLVGALAGMELKDLLDKMEWGQTYVNVHTVMYPGGEIRGQISGGK
ncbi:CHRD domain-containing protein [uncultured Sunxiuqinia sp.]|uniref:CHRD domain-containing protein n=1 Tax=uncultured Sunxiuqinia sp. TaxID=1573825 RepID=UPI0030D9AAEB|tara:strand:- start:10967 stop:11500 length:534 start_codon:yes stop_codon:yes gene_type:complete